MDLRSGWVCYVGYGPKDHLLGTFDKYMTAQLSELFLTKSISASQNRQGRMKATWQTGPMRLLDFAITPDRKRMIGIASVSGRSAGRNANVEPAASRMPEPGLATLTPSRRNEDLSAAIDWPVDSIGTMEKHIVVYDLADGSQLA